MGLRERVWPAMAKEIAWGWYHELFVGHPDRVRLPWAEFASRYAPLDWDSPEMLALLAAAVPDPVDRIDFAALDRPLDGLHADRLEALQPLVRARIAEDLRQHVDDRHTPHLGAFVAMLSVYAEVTRLAGVGRAVRPLPRRRPALVAGLLQRGGQRPARVPGARAAGPVPGRLHRLPRRRHVGGGGWRPFRAGSATLAGAPPVTTRALVDARLPDPSAARSTDRLLAGLLAGGEVTEEALVDDDGTVLRNTGLIRVRPATAR